MELKEVHYVYALIDALDVEVYIGKTCNPEQAGWDKELWD